MVLRNCTKLITVSRSLRREFLTRGFDRERLVCIPNGVPELPPSTRLRVENATWRLGMIALFRPRKGLEVLLEALKLLPASAPSIEVEIIGGFETRIRASHALLVSKFSLQSKSDLLALPRTSVSRIANFGRLSFAKFVRGRDADGRPGSFGGGRPSHRDQGRRDPEVVRDGQEGIWAIHGIHLAFAGNSAFYSGSDRLGQNERTSGPPAPRKILRSTHGGNDRASLSSHSRQSS